MQRIVVWVVAFFFLASIVIYAINFSPGRQTGRTPDGAAIDEGVMRSLAGVVGLFMAARQEGNRAAAAAFLTGRGVAAYDRRGYPLVPGEGNRFTGIELHEVRRAGANRYRFVVRIIEERSSDKGTAVYQETLTLVPVDGEFRIDDVERSELK